jgi:hypothetical protein
MSVTGCFSRFGQNRIHLNSVNNHCIFGDFPAKNTLYTPHIYRYMVLANPILHSSHSHDKLIVSGVPSGVRCQPQTQHADFIPDVLRTVRSLLSATNTACRLHSRRSTYRQAFVVSHKHSIQDRLQGVSPTLQPCIEKGEASG